MELLKTKAPLCIRCNNSTNFVDSNATSGVLLSASDAKPDHYETMCTVHKTSKNPR
jgi:hypothetical protein